MRDIVPRATVRSSGVFLEDFLHLVNQGERTFSYIRFEKSIRKLDSKLLIIDDVYFPYAIE